MSGSYVASIAIHGKTLFVDGVGASVAGMPANYVFEIEDDSNVRITGLSVTTGTGPGTYGFFCNVVGTGAVPTIDLDQVDVRSGVEALSTRTCKVTVSRSHLAVQSVNDFSIQVLNGTVTIDRTLIEGGGVAALDGGILDITNSVIRNAGSAGAFQGAANGPLGNAGVVTVSYSTIINSTVPCGAGTPGCASGTAAGSCINSSLILNTLIGAPADSIASGTSCVTNYSLAFPQSSALHGSNNKVGVNPALKDPTGGDYHLQPGSPAVDSADPGNPGTVDFDGTARPQGTRGDIGAFELKQ